MVTQRQILTKAIGYLIVEMLFLFMAVVGKSRVLPQPESTYWFTYGGLLVAGFCAYFSYCYFALYCQLRITLRQVTQETHDQS